ncbi:ester cyclase [Rhodococcus olei]|uniref:Ester cyclase n=1 Tax=Rhodococcus olei TaxID=2161675 RepID=A0ABP8PHH9_9NOCA
MTNSALSPTHTAPDRNIATMRRIYDEIFGAGRLELIDELFDPNMVNHTAPEAHRHGTAPLRALVTMLRTAFPDGRTDFEDFVATGDVVVGRNWYAGTHLGEFMGNAPTGRAFRFRQMHWMRFSPGGRVVEHWGLRDDVTHLQQLGIIA